jgi:hypothetical protein
MGIFTMNRTSPLALISGAKARILCGSERHG